MRILILAISVILLTGCGAPIKKPEFNQSMLLTMEIDNDIGYDSRNRRINGQAKLGNGRCHLKLPTVQDFHDRQNMNTWGHELMHCVYGNFHD